MAYYFYSTGAYEQSAELYESLYHRTANRYYFEMLVSSYMESGNLKKAEETIRQRMKNNPKEKELYVSLGQLYDRKGDHKKARRTYKEAMESLGKNVSQATKLADAFVSAGLVEYAIATYTQMRENTQNRYLYIPEMASLYGRLGNYTALVGEYITLMDRSSNSLESIQVSLQRMIHDSGENPKLFSALRSALVARVQDHPDDKQNVDMMIWLSLQERDFTFALDQAKALDARFPDQRGEAVWKVGEVSRTNRAFDVAHDAYAYLISKGKDGQYFMSARTMDLQVGFEQVDNGHQLSNAELNPLLDAYATTLKELGVNEQTIQLNRNYANLLAYQRHDLQGAVDVLYDILDIRNLKPRARDEVKIELADVMLVAGEVWEASLLYMQVEKANKEDVLGSMAKLRNARLSYYKHDFLWAKSQLEVLRASTSKLVANDAMELSLLIGDNMDPDDSTFYMLEIFADADFLMYRNRLDSAWYRYDEIEWRSLYHPLLDEVLMRKAQIRVKQGRYIEADSLLGNLISFYPNDILADDALYLRGTLNEDYLHREAVALDCYERLLVDYPSSTLVDRVRQRYDTLRKR